MGEPTLEEMMQIPDKEMSIKDVLRGIIGMRDALYERLDKLEENLQRDFVKVKEDVSGLKQDCQNIRSRVDGLEAAGDAFLANLSLLVLNLPVDENEDEDTLKEDVEVLLRDGLEVGDVAVTAVQRIPPRSYAAATADGVNEIVDDGGNARTGVVKVRLESLEQKKRCLRNKQNLRTKPDFAGVQVRNCEDHASRLNRLNMDTLLRDMGKRDQYRFTGSGRLVRHDGRQFTGNERNGHAGGERNGHAGDGARPEANADGPATRASRGRGQSGGRGGGQPRGRGQSNRGPRGGRR